jgi:hypothetical protein
MYHEAAFRDYFLKIGRTQNTCNFYNSYLGRIDEAIGGLDEKIEAAGIAWVINWSRTTTDGPFAKSRVMHDQF